MEVLLNRIYKSKQDFLNFVDLICKETPDKNIKAKYRKFINFKKIENNEFLEELKSFLESICMDKSLYELPFLRKFLNISKVGSQITKVNIFHEGYLKFFQKEDLLQKKVTYRKLMFSNYVKVEFRDGS